MIAIQQLLFLVLAVASAQGTECPDGFVDISGGCYSFSQQLGQSPRPAAEAAVFCYTESTDDYHVHLITMGRGSASEEDPVFAYILDNGLANPYMYIGAEKNGSSYSWVDGRPLSLNSHLWLDNEPNDGRLCVYIDLENPRNTNRIYIEDVDCLRSYDFACEITHY